MQKNRLFAVGASLLFVLGLFLTAVAGEEQLSYLPVVYNPPPTSTPLPTPTSAPPALVNGNFEAGHVAWLEYSALGFPIIVDDSELPDALNPVSGQWATWFGGANDELSAIIQQFTVPPSASTLSYYRWIASEDYCNPDYDIAGVVMDDDGNVTEDDVLDAFYLCGPTSTGGWQLRALDIAQYAGKPVELTFLASTDGVLLSSLFVDDVSLGTSSVTGGEAPGAIVVLPAARPARGDAAIGGSNDLLQTLDAVVRGSLMDSVEAPVEFKD